MAFDVPARTGENALIVLDGTESCALILESPDQRRVKVLPAAPVTGLNVVRRILEESDFDEWKVWRYQAEIVRGAIKIRTSLELVDVERVLRARRVFAITPARIELTLPRPILSQV